MSLSSSESVHWAATALIETLVLILALRSKVFRQLPLFTIYLGLVVLNEAIISLTYHFAGINSRTSFYAYWILQALQIIARAAVVYEICRVLLSPYMGVWRIVRPLLIMVGVALAVSAVIAAGPNGKYISPIVIIGERGFESTIVGILLIGLLFCRYYQIRIDRHLMWIALGLGFYSAVQMVNNSFLSVLFLNYLPLWKDIRTGSFNIATVLWGVALWKPLAIPKLKPTMLEPGTYETLAPRMTSYLHALNSRLSELWK